MNHQPLVFGFNKVFHPLCQKLVGRLDRINVGRTLLNAITGSILIAAVSSHSTAAEIKIATGIGAAEAAVADLLSFIQKRM